MIRQEGDKRRSLEPLRRGMNGTTGERSRTGRQESDRLQRLGAQTRGITHDFGNLLMVVATQVEMARMDSAETPHVVGALDIAQHAVAQAQALVDRLNSYAKGGQPRHLPVDLSKLVTHHARLLRAILPRDVALVEDLHVEPPIWIEGDAVQLGRVLTNLAMNARDALPDGGRMTLSLHVRALPGGAGEAVLQFEDTGHGMDPATCERAFEPFFTTKGGSGGNGLGLAIVREIVTAHGGRIDLCSRLGCGTRITVALPLPARTLDDVRRPTVAESVVVVARDVRIRAAASAALLDAGYTVVFAANAAEILALTERSSAVIRSCVVEARAVSPADLEALQTWGPWAGVANLVVVEQHAGGPAPAQHRAGQRVHALPRWFRPADLLDCVSDFPG